MHRPLCPCIAWAETCPQLDSLTVVAASRAEIVARIERLTEQLSRKPTRLERKMGWTNEARRGAAGWLSNLRTRLLDSRPLRPDEIPSSLQAFRTMDALGIDVSRADNELAQQFFALWGDLRHIAIRE